MKKSCFLVSLVLLVVVSACEDEPEPEPEAATEAEPEASPEPEPEPTRELMAEHFRKAWSARDAVIRGDFASAKTDVGWLAEHDQSEALPPDLQPKLAPMQEAATEFVEATALADAGIAFSRMLHRCGECHAAAEGGPEFDPEDPPEGEGLEAEMQRHRWAADRMWEGMVAPDVEAFSRAAGILAETDLKPEEIADDVDPARLEGLANHVHEMAQQAKDAENEEQRIEAYGRFIASCAGCHRLVGKGPGHDSEPSLTNDLVGEETAE